ncbi:putative periplasmic lipoprotein [Anopheles sinensis]|uniref:Putative periplasmic lipoprotein n=1 Tax=Anopheles sinensis TaxID=74873 RepID=A0A084W859_ANOSI|nr:putative periplasmic lipoprotein [Anopheles sinensis]
MNRTVESIAEELEEGWCRGCSVAGRVLCSAAQQHTVRTVVDPLHLGVPFFYHGLSTVRVYFARFMRKCAAVAGLWPLGAVRG